MTVPQAPPVRPSYLRPALIGGFTSGFVSAVPLISLFNCFCCSLFIAGGFLAAFLLSRDFARAGLRFSVGDGAAVGALAAVVSGIVFNVLMSFLPEPDYEEILGELEGQGVNVPPEIRDLATEMAGGTFEVAGIIMAFLLAGVFSTVGGLIGGALFRTQSPEPPHGY